MTNLKRSASVEDLTQAITLFRALTNAGHDDAESTDEAQVPGAGSRQSAHSPARQR